MKFTIEFEFLSLSSMTSDSEFSSGLFPVLLFLFNFILRKILKEHEVQLPPFKMPQTVPMQPFCCVLAPAVFRPPIWWHFRILLTVEHCDHCEHEIHNRVWVLELELNELQFWVLLWSFSCGSELNSVLRKILREQEVQLPPFKMPQTVPMQPLMSYPCMASVLSWILGWQWWMITSSSRHCHVRFWWLVTGRNPGRFGWSFLLVTPCLTSASSIIQQLFEKGGAAWAQRTPILSSPLVFFVWFWTYNFILRKILKEQEVQLPSIQHLRFCLKRVVLGCSSRATSAKSNGFVTPWGTAFKILTAEPWNLLDAMAFHTELQDLRGQTNLGASGIRFDVEWNFIRTSPKLFLR